MRFQQRLACLLLLAFAAPLWAQEGGGPATESGQRDEPDQATAVEQTVEAQAEDQGPPLPELYFPPPRALLAARVGAATRGPRSDLPAIETLAPDHVGLTAKGQPTLWWYLSADTEARIDVTLIDDSADPLIELTLPTPVPAGFHSLPLARHGVTLQPGTTYYWYVAIVTDPNRRSHDVIASGAVERFDPSPAVARDVSAAKPEEAFLVLARNGIWYDAIASVSEPIQAAPGEAALRALRAALLEQVGVRAAAARDRAGG